jgi:spore photoproduct lyase
MEFFEIAGKYSYSDQLKITLFKRLFNAFPQSWREGQHPFFYLCMEKPQLWEPVFGYSYNSNKDFEDAMKKSYFLSLNL